MTERKEGSKNIIVALITLFSSQFFQMLKMMVMIRTFIYGINLCIIPAMNVARKEIKALIPQRLHIPSTQLRLLDSVEHGNEANDVASYSDTLTGEFGEVYKAHLIAWHGKGDPQTVAVKTLRGQ